MAEGAGAERGAAGKPRADAGRGGGGGGAGCEFFPPFPSYGDRIKGGSNGLEVLRYHCVFFPGSRSHNFPQRYH